MKQHPRYPDIFVAEDGSVFRRLTPVKDDGGYHQIRNAGTYWWQKRTLALAHRAWTCAT
jgi:hypothetical protein